MYNPNYRPPKPANVSSSNWGALTTLFGYRNREKEEASVPQTEIGALRRGLVGPGGVGRRRQMVGLRAAGKVHNFGGGGSLLN